MSLSGTSAVRKPQPRGKLRAPKRSGLELPIQEMWQRLARAVHEIHNHNSSTLSYEENYRYAYNFVLYNQGAFLYSGISKLMEDHLTAQCQEKIVPAFPPGGMLALPPGIILPKLPPNPATSTSKPKAPLSAKAKGKARAIDTDNSVTFDEGSDVDGADGLGRDTNSGALSSISASQLGGDKTDAVARAQAGERLLKAIRDVWDDHCACTSTLSKVLKYVDRMYVPQEKLLPSWDLGLELFRENVPWSRRYPIQRNLYGTLLTQIQIEREGAVVNRSAIKSCIEMLVTLSYPRPNVPLDQRSSLYKQEFEPAFLGTSVEFYRAEAERKLDSGDAAEYLRHVERRLAEEEDRVTVYLNSSTGKNLRLLLEKYLLSDHLPTIIEMPGSGIKTMLDEERDMDLERLYTLFKRVTNGISTLRAGLKKHINEKGAQLNQGVSNLDVANNKAQARVASETASGGMQSQPTDEADSPEVEGKGKGKATVPAPPPADGKVETAASKQAALALSWVEQVLAFKARFDDLWKKALGSDPQCEGAISEAFEDFINKCPRASEFISLFIDDNLKKGIKGRTEEEVDEVLDRTIAIFRFLNQKDVFERYYKTHLAKRLLGNRSVSDDAERNMMAKLKLECGHNYVHKLQGMLNDMKLSDEANQAFTKRQQTGANQTHFDLSVNVLTSTFWPAMSGQDASVTWPAQMQTGVKIFESYYYSRHSGRKLSWQPNLGTVDVRVQFKARKHELNVSTFAMIVLCLFEDRSMTEPLSFADIKASTKIADGELKRTLQSLACTKQKILLKEPKGKDISEGDKFVFNENFTSPLARIKIAQIAARVETQAERKETNEKVIEERQHLTDASIVRIMKDRKECTHNELVNEAIRQISARFQPSPADIKKRIEVLMDREYLERSETNKALIRYCA